VAGSAAAFSNSLREDSLMACNAYQKGERERRRSRFAGYDGINLVVFNFIMNSLEFAAKRDRRLGRSHQTRSAGQFRAAPGGLSSSQRLTRAASGKPVGLKRGRLQRLDC
jgi:hypothetical protein